MSKLARLEQELHDLDMDYEVNPDEWTPDEYIKTRVEICQAIVDERIAIREATRATDLYDERNTIDLVSRKINGL